MEDFFKEKYIGKLYIIKVPINVLEPLSGFLGIYTNTFSCRIVLK